MAEPSSVADKALEKLSDQLRCTICLESFTDPKLLQCFHVFCKECLEQRVVQDQHEPSLCCPKCRRSTPVPASGVSDLQSAFYIHGLFEIQDALKKVKQGQEGQKTQCEKCKKAEASGFCRNCGFVCESCIGAHQIWDQLFSHEIISLEQLKNDLTSMMLSTKKISYCSKHPGKELDLFCESDQELLCRDCIVRTHRDHQYDLVSEVFPKHKTFITTHLERVDQHLSTVQIAIQDLDTARDEIMAQQAAVGTEIQRKIIELQEALEVRKNDLMSQLEQMTQQKLENISTQMDKLELLRTRLDSCLQYVTESLKTCSEGEILAMEKPAVEQISELCTEHELSPLEEADTAFFISKELLPACQHFGELYRETISPERCCIFREGLQSVTVDQQNTITFHTVSAQGSEFTKPLSDGNISCELVSCSNIESPPLKYGVKPTKAGEYQVSCQPSRRGRHELHIKVSDQHILGSPFTIVAGGKFDVPIRTITGLKGPWGVVINDKGQLIITERKGHCISIYESNGKKVKSFGQKGSARGQFSSLHGVAVDSEDNIITTDGGSNHIQKFTADDTFMEWITSSGGSPCLLGRLLGISTSQSGKVYVCDKRSHQVHILNPDLKLILSFGSKGSEDWQFQCPRDVTSNNRGKLYIADSENHRIQVFTEEGQFLINFGKEDRARGFGGLDYPAGVAIDSNNVVYVSERRKGYISLFTSEGQFLRSFGTRGGGPGQFDQPRGVAVDKDGFVYVCDYGNNRLQVW